MTEPGSTEEGKILPTAPSLPLPTSSSSATATSTFDSFQAYCDTQEISERDCRNLFHDLNGVRIGILVDDSSSMDKVIKLEGMNSFDSINSTATRWTEATKFVCSTLEIVLALKPHEGIDLYFMNRASPTETIQRDVSRSLSIDLPRTMPAMPDRPAMA